MNPSDELPKTLGRTLGVTAVVIAALAFTACSTSSSPIVTSPTSVQGNSGTASPTTTASTPSPSSVTIPSTLGGNAHPVLSPGQPGQLDVIYVGSASSLGGVGTSVPVAVWNGTSHAVNHIDVSGPAMSGGSVVGSGDSQDIEPMNLAPGEVAFGMVYFSTSLPAGATFGFTASASQGTSTYFVDAQVTQANYSSGSYGDDSVVGSVSNPSSQTMNGPIEADVYCFNSAGQLSDVEPGFTSGNAPIAPGASASFSTDGIKSGSCPTFLVGSSGYGQEP